MAGTTANVAIIMKGMIHIGRAGDSVIVLGYQDKGVTAWKGLSFT
jgi:hypothetical protein